MRAGRLGVAQWLARFVRDPEVYITVSNDVLRRGVAQWLARFVRDEEAGGSSPLTPTINLLNSVTQFVIGIGNRWAVSAMNPCGFRVGYHL